MNMRIGQCAFARIVQSNRRDTGCICSPQDVQGQMWMSLQHFKRTWRRQLKLFDGIKRHVIFDRVHKVAWPRQIHLSRAHAILKHCSRPSRKIFEMACASQSDEARSLAREPWIISIRPLWMRAKHTNGTPSKLRLRQRRQLWRTNAEKRRSE